MRKKIFLAIWIAVFLALMFVYLVSIYFDTEFKGQISQTTEVLANAEYKGATEISTKEVDVKGTMVAARYIGLSRFSSIALVVFLMSSVLFLYFKRVHYNKSIDWED